MKTGYKVGDAMTFNPISVAPDTTIVKCSKIMDEKHIGSLLIIKDKKLMGIITEYDIVRKVVAKLKDPSKITAKDIMVKKPITITPEKDIYDALVKLRDNDIRHLPVTIEKELKGFLTLKDILKIEPELFDLVVEDIVLREEEEKPLDNNFQSGICDSCHKFSSTLMEDGGLMLCRSCRRPN